MNQFDVIIVGGGPAGSTAGYTLAKAGLRTMIIDQSHFPRRKICGGGLTERAYHQLPFDVSPAIHHGVDWGYIGFKGHLITSIHADGPAAYMIDRSSFDNLLLEKASALGVITKLGQRVRSIKQDKNAIQVITDQGEYFSSYLVGADGVHSVVAKQVGLITNRSVSLAYEARHTLPPSPQSSHLETITFDFGTISFGYGWIFPKRDHLNVGVCRTWPGKKAGKKHLYRFIEQHPGLQKDKIIDIRAYPVPLGGGRKVFHKNKVLLVGDAANLADPWLGEGLYYAFLSGQLAAKTIIIHIKGIIPDLSGYSQQINTFCMKQFSYARRFSLLVNLSPYINVQMIKSSRTLQNLIITLLRGEHTYKEAWCNLLSAAPKILLNKVIRKK